MELLFGLVALMATVAHFAAIYTLYEKMNALGEKIDKMQAHDHMLRFGITKE